MLLDRSAALPKASAEYTLRDQERMSLARNYFQWQASMVEPYIGRRVLEVGCGLGNFTRYLLNREWSSASMWSPNAWTVGEPPFRGPQI